MNLAQKMLARGTAVLAKQSPQSERVTFEGVTYSANVNRDQSDPAFGGVIDLQMESGAIVDLPVALGVTPTQGGSFTAARAGEVLMIRRAFHIGHSIRCVCAVIAP